MKSRFCSLILQFLMLSSFPACTQEQMKIVPFSYLDSLQQENSNAKFQYYLIENYKDTEKNKKTLDSFVLANADSSLMAKYRQYTIVLYKKSAKTNPEHLRLNPRDLDRYSTENDRIFKYLWLDGQFMARFKFKKDRIINEKSKVKVKIRQ